MKTDDLIALLSTNVERVSPRRFDQTLVFALVVGAAGALIAMLLTLGVRPDANQSDALTLLISKLVFGLGVVVFALIALTRHARPGGEHKISIALAVLPFAGIILLAALSLASAPHSHWETMIVGDDWLECLLSIPIIAVAPFACLIWAVRQMAPTNLPRAGALVGLVAGGVSASAYALHCDSNSLPFVAVWYGGTILLCTLAGAKLAPYLLRW